MATVSLMASAPATAGPTESSRMYRVCADRDSGAIRLVPTSRRCRAGEIDLLWTMSGPAGMAGPVGPQGFGDGSGAADLVQVRRLVTVPPRSSVMRFLTCPAGTVAVDGTMGPAVGSRPGLELAQSFSWSPRQWVVVVENDAGVRRTVFVGAMCSPGGVVVDAASVD